MIQRTVVAPNENPVVSRSRFSVEHSLLSISKRVIGLAVPKFSRGSRVETCANICIRVIRIRAAIFVAAVLFLTRCSHVVSRISECEMIFRRDYLTAQLRIHRDK